MTTVNLDLDNTTIRLIEQMAKGSKLTVSEWISCQVSSDWISYNYLKSKYLVEACKDEIISLLRSEKEETA